MKLILLAVLTASILAAQVPVLQLDLSGEWRFQAGDTADFAKAEFDDRAWETRLLPWTGVRPQNTWWLRREVVIPEWAGLANLVLTLGGMNEVYEVFVNGTRIAAVGGHSIWQEFVARPRSFAVPPGLIPAGNRRCVLALRLWRSGWAPSAIRSADRLGFSDAGPYLLTFAANAPQDPGAASMARRERSAIPSLVAMAFNAALALLLTLGFLIHRERKDLLLLAGLLASEILLRAGEFVSVVNDWTNGEQLPIPFPLTLSPLLLTYFAAISLGVRSRWLRLAAWIPFLQHVASMWQIGATGAVGPMSPVMNFGWSGMAMMAAVALLAGQSLYWAVRRAEWRGASLPLGILAIALLLGARSDFLNSVFRTPTVNWAGMLVRPLDFVLMLAALMVSAHLLRQLGAARQRLSGELEAARVVQQLLLPGPGIAGPDFEIEAEYRPAQEVGGDFYQVLVRDDASRVVVLGDVSGKGLKAAMVVSVAVGILRNEKSARPGAILAALNEGLVGQLGGAFVTCCCARFAPDGSVTMANAGHPSPYCDGREVPVEGGLPLGIAHGIKYDESTVRGSRFTFVSDGVVEAANEKGELFGFERTREISTKSAQEIANAAKAWGQNDDITVVTVRRNT